ncbi:exodeoxyribonuclease VII large subunit [Rhodobacteraceae bacterium NNCM2]|nr:exodeoxyribonuclease VII large subunit [Coraliihabitans acroporae]
MSLIDDAPEGVNTPEFSVSEISGAVKRMVEGEFGHVRVRGEVGRVSRPRSGHVYLDLKDDRSVLAGVLWKGVASRLTTQPEEGMEVVATGRLTTFPGQSKYQMVIEDIAPAGVGALMAMLEKRKAKLAAEGLFDPARKKQIPYLPRVIGVVTSPSGAVIRDILHRLAERFPTRVLVWPVAVQGERCAPEVAAAIEGFAAMKGAMRPDLVIVARGGGSVEDLWGFNEEAVVRAVAACPIPLISAVGHETDTTLIDFVSDLRAPTPTAAAERAVPVRAELMATIADLEARRTRALAGLQDRARQRLGDLVRALPRPERLLEERRQRLDNAVLRLPRPVDLIDRRRDRLEALSERLPNALRRVTSDRRIALTRQAGRLTPGRLRDRLSRSQERLEGWAARLGPAYARSDQKRADRLASLVRMLATLGYRETLARGYAVVRADGAVVADAASVKAGEALEIEFRDGRITTGGAAPSLSTAPAAKKPKPKSPKPEPGGQGSLF